MRLAEICKLLGCEVICAARADHEPDIATCFAADLMSDVLAKAGKDALLITGLTSAQVVHTADVADLKAVMFVCSKRPPQQVIDMAAELGLPLLTTHHTMFAASGLLWAAGLHCGQG